MSYLIRGSHSRRNPFVIVAGNSARRDQLYKLKSTHKRNPIMTNHNLETRHCDLKLIRAEIGADQATLEYAVLNMYLIVQEHFQLVPQSERDDQELRARGNAPKVNLALDDGLIGGEYKALAITSRGDDGKQRIIQNIYLPLAGMNGYRSKNRTIKYITERVAWYPRGEN